MLNVLWLQLVEFLDVIDDPILGYTAPAVITVLHTQLATCAVDYRSVQTTVAENPSNTFTHSHTDGGVMHAGRQPARQYEVSRSGTPRH